MTVRPDRLRAPERVVPSARGTCFGFEVRSSLAFRYLRDGTGGPLEVSLGSCDGPAADDRLFLEWKPPRHPFAAQLYGDDQTFRLWVTGTGWFDVDPDAGRIVIPPAPDRVRLEERIWGIPALLCFVARGDVPVHAAAVQIGDGAVLLAAPGRFGKTTLASAFAAAGYRVLSEDLSCVRLGDRPSVVPGPAMMRLRPDVARHIQIDGTEAWVGEDRVHLALDPRRRGDCTPVPLRAVVFLREGPDGIAVERADPNSSIADLWTLSFHLPTDRDRTRTFSAVAELVSSVDVWNLARPMTFDALPATLKAIGRLMEGGA